MSDLLTRSIDFEPTRAAGLARLEAFAPFAASAYTNKRNFDFGPNDRSNVSALSPWIAHRLITEEEVCAAILSRFAFSSAEKFIQEVCWRTYWKGWLEQRPQVFADYERARDAALHNIDRFRDARANYEAAIAGNTGIDCFDAWAKELVATGYLHNHARMWFASIWIFTLRLDWSLGADFFFRHLMDGDPASNTLSWRWVAGLQTVGKNYLARASNIEKFTDGRFSPKGLNENAAPLTGPSHPALRPLPVASPPPQNAKIFVAFTDDECSAEQMNFGNNQILGAASLNLIDERSPLPVGARAKAFTQIALAEAGKRFEQAHDLIVNSSTAKSLPDTVAATGATHLVMPYTPHGPSRSVIDGIRHKCHAQNIAFHKVHRRWDQRAWPHATKGFFAFKEHIPAMLRDAGLQLGSKRG